MLNNEEHSQTEPTYLKNYGLREAPFSTNPDNKYIYLDEERAQRLNKLQQLCRFSNLLLLVEGVVGVGKTTLVQRFVQASAAEYTIGIVAANTMMDAEQFLYQAAQSFGVRELPRDADDLMGLLYERVATIHHADQIPVLIIDDAHLLPKDALLAIFNLADTFVNEVNLLRLILVCEPQIEKILGSKDLRSLRDRVTHTMDIPLLNQQTTAEYLKHRMAVAGFDGGSPFTPALVKKIYRTSRGIPAQINLLAHQALEEGDVLIATDQVSEELSGSVVHTPERPAIPYMYAGVAVLLVGIVWFLLAQISGDADSVPYTEDEAVQADSIAKGQAGHQEQVSNDAEQEQTTTELDVQERIISLAEPPPEAVDLKSTNQDPATGQDPSGVPNVETNTTVGETGNTKTMDQQVVSIEKVPPRIDTIDPSTVTASNERQTISLHGQGFSPASEVTIHWSGHEKHLTQEQVQIISAEQIDISVVVGMDNDNWTVSVVDPQSGASNDAGFVVVGAEPGKATGKTTRLLSQNPAGYTLQLFSTNDLNSAKQFIEKHGITGDGGYFHTLRNGRDWYSVIYGSFPDKSGALQAVKALPESLKKTKPWIRKIADIQTGSNPKQIKTSSEQPKPVVAATNSEQRIPLLTDIRGASSYEAWLWSQDPETYTLQLLGAQQKVSIENFLRKYKDLNGKAVYFHTQRDASDWYAVVYGVYPDRDKAKQAIKRLPVELQSTTPWIRSFGSIHAELGQAQ